MAQSRRLVGGNRKVPLLANRDIIRGPLFHIQPYAALGQTLLTFFQTAAGQGTTTVQDTNMIQPGSVPAGQRFVVQGIEVMFWPGVPLSAFGAAAAAEYLNDVQDVMASGLLRFTVGTKEYARVGPLNRFPPSCGLNVSAAFADTTTAAADRQTRAQYASAIGRPFAVDEIEIIPQLNFSVTMEWTTAVPISVAGRIGVYLNGYTIRNAQ